MTSETPSPASGAPAEAPKPASAEAPRPACCETAKPGGGEAPRPAEDAGHEMRRERIRGQRSLFIHVLLMFLVSIVVFVIGTYFFVVPYIISQDLAVRQAQQMIADLQWQVEELQAEIYLDEEELPEGAVPGQGAPAGEGGAGEVPAPAPEGAAPAPAPAPAPEPAPAPGK